jgi:hypothetical protein
MMMPLVPERISHTEATPPAITAGIAIIGAHAAPTFPKSRKHSNISSPPMTELSNPVAELRGERVVEASRCDLHHSGTSPKKKSEAQEQSSQGKLPISGMPTTCTEV